MRLFTRTQTAQPPTTWLWAASALLTATLVACTQSAPDGTPTASGMQKHAEVTSEPVTVQVCGTPVTYPRAPERAVTHDVNITEMLLFLGLQDRWVGYSGIPARKEMWTPYQSLLAARPNLSSQGMNLEAMLGVSADFVFAGWNYGFRQGQVTPQVLQQHGMASYVLSESCIRVGPRPRVGIEDTLADLRNLAKIFRITARAEPQVQALERDLQDLRARMQAKPAVQGRRGQQEPQGPTPRPRVFVYDSGQDIPMTSGRYGMPQALIEEAGGRNIFDDIASNWPHANWEDVVQRNPEWIVVVDYGEPSAQGKIEFLLRKPELQTVDAVRHHRFITLSYAEATPSPRNVAAARTLANALHPERMAAPR
uniref:ABC transporter substrate-binding protein n=1 Tax=Acidovorax sp. DW039 TaxID=3095606 RepID=UPI00403FA3FF